MMVEIPDHLVNAQGKTVFTALMVLRLDGTLQLLVPMVDLAPGAKPEDWLTATVACPAGRAFASQLEVYGRGGGTA